ncbi:MAG: TonB-dependent receptor [Pseudomonadota bacterium]
MQRIHYVPLTMGLLALAVSSAHAQNSDQDQDGEIYELVTTAIHVRSAETALPVTLLTGEELHKSVRATIGDTLASQPGLSNASFGPAVGQTVIRGQQGRRVMNLTNSMPNADAAGNSSDHAQTVEPLLATSIEVLRGPATLLYGGGAIGGVVNVIDRRIVTSVPDRPAFAFETRHDSSSDLQNHIGSADFATGSLVWHVDAVQREWNDLEIPDFAVDPALLAKLHAEQETTEGAEEEAHDEAAESTYGYLANSGGETTTGTAGVSWIFDNGHLGFAFNKLDNRYGLPPVPHHGHEGEEEVEENIAIDMERSRYDISGEWHEVASWLEQVDYDLSHTNYGHVELEGTETGTHFSNDSWQQRVQLTMNEWRQWHGVVGMQNSREEFAAVGEESFIPASDITTDGLFIVEDFHAEALTWEFGARINRDSYQAQQQLAPEREFNTTSLSASALWQQSDPLTIGLSLASSERAPSVEELYSNHGLDDLADCVIHHATGACEIGDVNFTEERSFNTDLTFTWNAGDVTTSVTLFDNRFHDYIAQVNDGREVDELPVRLYLQDDAHFYGVEVDIDWQLNEQFALRLFGDSMRGSLDTFGDMPRLPPRRFGMQLDFTDKHWTAYASVQHALSQQRPGAFELGSDSWTRLEIGADYTLDFGDNGELQVFVKGRNLLDDTIRMSTSYLRSFAPEAARSVETGLRYRY